ncbi:MAG: hypothetical protein AAGA90_07940 [Actinomycetota bacterium]
MSDQQTEPAAAADEPDDGLIGVRYTGGVALDVQLPSGWQQAAPGSELRCTPADVDALRAHPDFDTPPQQDVAEQLAAMTGPELNQFIDDHELDVAKSLNVPERRQAIAAAITPEPEV